MSGSALPPPPGVALGRNLKHDLRTPLNHILGYCDILREEAQDRAFHSMIADLDHIRSAGRNLLGVVNDLFDPDKAPAYRSDASLLDREVRTPLTQIIGYAEMLQEEAEADQIPRCIDDLGKINTAARRLLELIIEQFGPGANHAPAPLLRVPRAIERASPERRLPLHTGTILVVEDDPANSEMLTRRLQRMGHLVELAENGRIALEILREKSFDVVLLDLQMPEMDGYQVLERISRDETLREIPVLVLSASDETSSVAYCIECGATDYLPKPVEPVVLRARIDSCLEKKRLRDRERAIHAELERSQRHLSAELARASEYVRSLLPARLSGAVETDWCFQPSEQLGGDAFGHHWIDPDHLAIYLVDVCGHGVGAALLSVSVLNTLRAQTLPGADFTDPAAVLSALNRAFPAEGQNFLYFTSWYGVYCVSRREIVYGSGGHPPALLLEEDESGGSRLVPLGTEGPAVGCFADAAFCSQRHPVQPGSRLLVFSDGVFEIFLADDRVQTWEEFIETFALPEVWRMRAEERLEHARQLRRAPILEDDYSLLELRFF